MMATHACTGAGVVHGSFLMLGWMLIFFVLTASPTNSSRNQSGLLYWSILPPNEPQHHSREKLLEAQAIAATEPCAKQKIFMPAWSHDSERAVVCVCRCGLRWERSEHRFVLSGRQWLRMDSVKTEAKAHIIACPARLHSLADPQYPRGWYPCRYQHVAFCSWGRSA